MNIDGFLVVRKAVHMATVQPFNRRFVVEDKEYNGIQRYNLYDIVEEYYNNALPHNINQIVEDVFQSEAEQPFRTFNEAKMVLDYCNLKNNFNEIIALQYYDSPGTILFEENKIDWLGYDVITDLNTSLLFLGMFSKSSYFSDLYNYVNSDGLFDEVVNISKYVDLYLSLANNGIVEDYIFHSNDLNIIKIGRVKV